MLERICLWSG